VERVERDGEISLSVRPEWRLLSTAGIAPDPGSQNLVDAHTATLDEELDVVIGKTAMELDSRRANVRSRETSFGNLVAEAMRWGTGADVGLTNGGGIRADRTYDAGTEITRRHILEELPFGNVTVLLELTGDELQAALENGVSQVEDLAGRFPQIAGMTLVYDPRAPAGGRVITIEVGNEPLRWYGRIHRRNSALVSVPSRQVAGVVLVWPAALIWTDAMLSSRPCAPACSGGGAKATKATRTDSAAASPSSKWRRGLIGPPNAEGGG